MPRLSQLLQRLNFQLRFGEILLALVLGYYSLRMISVAIALYSQKGLFPVEYSNSPVASWPIWGPLNSDLFLVGIHILLALASVAWIFNFHSRWAQILHLLSTWYFVNRNPSIFAPDTGFTQGILLILVVQSFITDKQKLALGWLLLGVAYTYAGLGKVSSPVWTGGFAVRYFLNMSDSTRLWVPEFGDFFHYPMMVMTYLVFVFEILSIALIFNRWGRLSVLLFFGFFHLVNVGVFDFVQLSINCLAVHLVVGQWAYHESEDFKFEFSFQKS